MWSEMTQKVAHMYVANNNESRAMKVKLCAPKWLTKLLNCSFFVETYMISMCIVNNEIRAMKVKLCDPKWLSNLLNCSFSVKTYMILMCIVSIWEQMPSFSMCIVSICEKCHVKNFSHRFWQNIHRLNIVATRKR